MVFLCTVTRPHFLSRALIWPRYFGEHACSQSFWIIAFEFLKVCGIRFSICESFVGFYTAAILFLRSWHVYFPLEFEFRGKSCVETEHGGEDGISCLLPCILLLYIDWM